REPGKPQVGTERLVELNQQPRCSVVGRIGSAAADHAAGDRCTQPHDDDRCRSARHRMAAHMPRAWSRPSIVASIYLVSAVVMTWPLATVMDRRIAGDMGDPLFVCWVILWTAGQAGRALSGDLSALARYWSGNIFFPAALTVAYSEHFTPQMLQALPILAMTDNVILAYNVLLLATFVLSALGTYLLVRDVTGRPLAALFAGLVFAYSPYRLDQYSHLQVLSCQWMPFTLYGWRRYAAGGGLRALAGGTAALVAQALSSIYYLAYFTPFAVAFLLVEMMAHGRLRDRRAWQHVGAA